LWWWIARSGRGQGNDARQRENARSARVNISPQGLD
jgi:hypothetical protein